MVHWRPVLAFEGMTYELELVDGGAGGKVWSRRVGADEASFLSGLAPGGSRVRVRSWLDSEPGPWSEPLDIVVDYPSHAMVRTLMFLGSVLFLATVGLVLGGHWTYRSESSTASRREEA